MKKIVISGANGFIGSRLINYLYKEGFEVRGLVRENADMSLIHPDVNCIRVDYNDQIAMAGILSESTVFIHCAAQTKARSFDEICRNNVDLTQTLIRLANQSDKLEHIIFLSSQAAGGPGEGHQAVSESDIPHPVSWYGKSKLLAEKNIQRMCQKNWTILRSASVYGPGDKDFFAYFQLIEKHLALHPGLSDKYISLIYVDDLIKIIRQVIGNETAFSKIYNCSDGRAYTVKSFIDTLALAMNQLVVSFAVPDYFVSLTGAFAEMLGRLQKKLPVLNRQKAKEFSHKNWLCSNLRLVNDLNFKPEKQLLDNLISTYKWYQKNNWLNNKNGNKHA